MHSSVGSLRRLVKGDLTIRLAPEALKSYGGLELLQRYLRRIDLVTRLRQTFAGLGSDYGLCARVALVVLALFYVGARRLEHLRVVSGGPLVAWLCGLARLPTRRTVANWLPAGDARGPKPRSRKRSMCTLRFLLIARAGRLSARRSPGPSSHPLPGQQSRCIWADRSTPGRMTYLPIGVSLA